MISSVKESFDAIEATNVSGVDTAIILAAGNGDRLQKGDKPKPKPLYKVGGLFLLERSILTLNKAGIKHFKVVTGAYADKIVPTIKPLKSLKGVDIEFVHCEQYAKGNGVSFSAGAAKVDGPFLLMMADHVMTIDMAKQLIDYAEDHPARPLLAVDENVEGVFDIDDATKVRSDEHGQIVDIGKSLTEYDLVDTGLFYFPAGYGRPAVDEVEKGAVSVSEIVRAINDESGFYVHRIENAVWQDVDTPAMAKEAEKRLLKSLIKPTDGPVSKYFNRKFSTQISRILARFRVKPNTVTTGVFLFSLAAAWLVAQPNYLYMLIAALMFQIASIVDGCDGELARLTHSYSDFGTWYDTVTDNIRYMAFYGALGINAYRSGGGNIYLWAVPLFVLLAVYMVGTMSRYLLKNNAKGTHLVVTKKVEETDRSNNMYLKVVVGLRVLVKQDVSALIAMGLIIVGLGHVMFWLVLAAVIVMTPVIMIVLKEEGEEAKSSSKGSFVFFLIGAAVLGYLFSLMPLHAVGESLSQVGSQVFIAFAIAFLWFSANTLSLSTLTGHRVGFLHLLYNRLFGEAINAIVPLLGVAGEPYKVKHLSNWLPLDEASTAVVEDKMINILSGMIFSAAACGTTFFLVPLESTARTALIVMAVLFAIGAVVFGRVILSRIPSKFSGFVLRKLKFAENTQLSHLKPQVFAVSLFYNLLGRFLLLFEIAAIFWLLGIEPSAERVIALGALISVIGTLFFVVPQGIGVSEAGITGAFVLLGFEPHIGLSFALIRRARIVFWAFIGLALHLVRMPFVIKTPKPAPEAAVK